MQVSYIVVDAHHSTGRDLDERGTTHERLPGSCTDVHLVFAVPRLATVGAGHHVKWLAVNQQHGFSSVTPLVGNTDFADLTEEVAEAEEIAHSIHDIAR